MKQSAWGNFSAPPTWSRRPMTGCGARSTPLWVHRNLFWQLSRDRNLPGSGMSHTMIASPKLSFRAAWRVGNAMVCRKNAEWTTSNSGHPCLFQNCSQGPPAEKTGRGFLLNHPSCSPDDPSGEGTELILWVFTCTTSSFRGYYLYKVSELWVLTVLTVLHCWLLHPGTDYWFLTSTTFLRCWFLPVQSLCTVDWSTPSQIAGSHTAAQLWQTQASCGRRHHRVERWCWWRSSAARWPGQHCRGWCCPLGMPAAGDTHTETQTS